MAKSVEGGLAKIGAAFVLAEIGQNASVPTSVGLGLIAISGVIGNIGAFELITGLGDGNLRTPQPQQEVPQRDQQRTLTLVRAL